MRKIKGENRESLLTTMQVLTPVKKEEKGKKGLHRKTLRLQQIFKKS